MRLVAREARAAAALNHPAIVTIYDLGVIEGRPFISMEFIEGTDLRTLLATKRSLQLTTCVDLGIRLAGALDYAHEHHVIHRDVKPANVIIPQGGTAGFSAKLLDFGVAKAIQGGKGAASMLAGTPQYMAPEQLSQGEIDGRADLFSLGVLLYRALTGKRPFHGLERQADVKPPSTHAPWVPAELDQVVRRAIALDPDDRYQRGRDMAAALAGALKNVADIDDGPTVFDPNRQQ
jgi:serine/threonine-protein kinase